MAGEPSLLTLGRVDRVRVQVGFRSRPTGSAYEQFLLDLALPETEHGVDETRILATLEPILYAGSDVPRHYSLHQHRWHTSWGANPNTVELGLLVTTGPRDAAVPADTVASAFRELLAAAGTEASEPVSRNAALTRARSAAASAYGIEAELLSVAVEQHHPEEGAWTVVLRGRSGEYDVRVGLVDGFPGSVRVRCETDVEVHDSVGSE
jgi:hypothetical protein